MPLRKSLRKAGVAVLAAIPLLPFTPVPVHAGTGGISLCLTDTRGSGEPVARLPLGDPPTFELSFIHSVSRTPVRDLYRVDGGQIIQSAEIFMGHGAGLPSIANDMDATGWRHENGTFILDMHRLTGPIPIRIQAEFKNTLTIAGTDLPLASLGHAALTLAPCDNEEPLK